MTHMLACATSMDWQVVCSGDVGTRVMGKQVIVENELCVCVVHMCVYLCVSRFDDFFHGVPYFFVQLVYIML